MTVLTRAKKLRIRKETLMFLTTRALKDAKSGDGEPSLVGFGRPGENGGYWTNCQIPTDGCTPSPPP